MPKDKNKSITPVKKVPKERKYSAKYDADYDPVTFEWLESACGNPDCEFCGNRPEKAKENQE